MGSGTTGVACAELGIDFIGIEKEPDYMEIAKRRIEHVSNQSPSQPEKAYRRATNQSIKGNPTDSDNLPLFANA